MIRPLFFACLLSYQPDHVNISRIHLIMSTSSSPATSQHPAAAPEYIVIGRVTRAHGLRGQVAVAYETHWPERFLALQRVFVGEANLPIGVAAARLTPRYALLSLIGVETRREAEALRGLWVKVPRAEAMRLGEGEFFVHQVVGLAVVTRAGELIGHVQEVLFTGANDVYVIETATGELLLPAVEDVIHEVNVADGRLIVSVPLGLKAA